MGDEELIGKIRRKWLEWLGCIVRMPAYRIPKQVLFGWLLIYRGSKKRM